MKEFETLALVIAKITGVTRDELVSKTRKRPIVELKMMCSHLLKNCSHDSSSKITVLHIGEVLNVDHSTITYHLKRHPDMMSQKDGKYKELYEKIFKAYKSNKALSIINDYERQSKMLGDRIKNEQKNLNQLIAQKEEVDKKIDNLKLISGYLGHNS
jgi:DNA-binding transcriptional ArsR family regulator